MSQLYQRGVFHGSVAALGPRVLMVHNLRIPFLTREAINACRQCITFCAARIHHYSLFSRRASTCALLLDLCQQLGVYTETQPSTLMRSVVISEYTTHATGDRWFSMPGPAKLGSKGASPDAVGGSMQRLVATDCQIIMGRCCLKYIILFRVKNHTFSGVFGTNGLLS